jgi:pimeloyl-ACP methyl ester carboxylesterase
MDIFRPPNARARIKRTQPRRAALRAVFVAAPLMLASCGPTTPTPGAASLALKECRVKGIDVAVKCATLDVFENRETRAGRKIGINIVVLPASARVKQPDPIFLFAGGPGQAAAGLAPQASMLLGALNAKRDIVLIDQRGTGRSNGLYCKVPDAAELGVIDEAARIAKSKALLRECRDALSKDADLTQYTTTIAMADYDDVRAALGFEKINLFGASYGTRSAMEYVRRYPDRVRSVVIDGVAPPSMTLPADFSRDAGATYDKLIAACEAETACRAGFPTLKADIDALLDGLSKSAPVVAVPDPITGIPQKAKVTRDMVLMGVFQMLYLPELSATLPSSLAAARNGNFAPLFAPGSLVGESKDQQLAMGMQLSVMCAEDIPRLAARKQEPAKPAPFGSLFIDEFSRACADWPRGKMAADFDQPVKSDKPVLLLSGGLDPVTPPVHAEEVKKSLTNAVHLVAPFVGHGVAQRGCAPKVVKKFIETASVAGIDGECLKNLPRPMFYQPMQERKSTEDHGVRKAQNGDQVGKNSEGTKK